MPETYCSQKVSFGLPKCGKQCAVCCQRESDMRVEYAGLPYNYHDYNPRQVPAIPLTVEVWADAVGVFAWSNCHSYIQDDPECVKGWLKT